MERIKLTKPISRLRSVDWREHPRSLTNAYLDKATGSVRRTNANRLVVKATEFVPGNKPNTIWNKRLLEGLNEGLFAGDNFNENFYAIDQNGLTVYPPDYNGSNADTTGPYVSQVTHDLVDLPASVIAQSQNNVSADPASGIKYASSDPQVMGVIGYVIIPFNERDEAGPWVFHSANFRYRKVFERTTLPETENEYTAGWYEKPEVRMQISAYAGTTSYVEVYRTVEHLSVLGFDSTATMYYMGRFQVPGKPGDNSTQNIVVNDDKMWWQPNYASTLIYWGWDKQCDTIERLLELGVVEAEKVVLPGATLNRAINIHAQLPSAAGPSYGDTITISLWDSGGSITQETRQYNTPTNFFARDVVNIGGTMVYSDVTWTPKYPALIGWQGTAAALGVNTITLQLEYRLSDGSIAYGPKLTLNNVLKVQVAWQGEQALLIYNNSGNLIERQVPDAYGRYVSGFKISAARPVWDPDANGGDGGYVSETVSRPVYWTYDASFLSVGAGVAHTAAASSSIREQNVALISEFERPWEVTLEQIFTPDNSRIRAVTNARIEETEQVLDYESYMFTKDSVLWFKIDKNTRTTAKGYVTPITGVKETGFSNEETPLVEEVPGGVIFVGEDGVIYYLTGRQYRRLDEERQLEGLWTEIWDIAYHVTDRDLWILTDTGIWVWDFDHYGGIYKHHSYTKASSANPVSLSYLKGTIATVSLGDVAYDAMMVYEGTLDEGTLVGKGSSKVVNAAVELHRTPWQAQPTKMSAIMLHAEHGPKQSLADLTELGALSIDTPTGPAYQNAIFDTAEEIGLVAVVQDGKSGGGAVQVALNSFSDTENASVSAVTGAIVTGGVTGKIVQWPYITVKHTLHGIKDDERTYVMMPGKVYFPKGSALEHGLTLERFESLHEINVEFREQ